MRSKHPLLLKTILRGLFSFGATIVVNVFVMLGNALCRGGDYTPMLKEYIAFFPSVSVALLVEMLLVGVIGAAFGACSVIFELERWSFLKQGIIHFLITAIVWLPLSVFIWCVYKYPVAIISMAVSYTLTYTVTWVSNAIRIKKMVKDINNMLE